MLRSITSRLFLIVFISFGLLLSSWIFWIHNDTERILLAQKANDLDQLIGGSSDYLKLYSENLSTALINLVSVFEHGSSDDQYIITKLNAFQKENSNRIQVAACILSEDRVLCSKQYVYEIFGENIFKECYKTAAQSQYLGIRWTEPYTSTLTLARTIALYKPTILNGRRIVLFMEIDLAHMLANFMNSNNATIWALVSQNGNSVATSYDYLSPELKASSMKSREAFVMVLPSIMEKSGMNSTESNFNHTDYLIRTKSNVCMGWNLLAFTSKQSLYALISPLTSRILVLGLIHLFVLAIVITIFGHHYTKPLTLLAHKLKTTSSPLELSFGNETSRKDEVGVLANSLQGLIDRVRALVGTQALLAEQQRMLEINTLQAQIRPHFLGNTLACIESLLKEGHWKEVQHSLHALTKLLNYSIARTDAMVPLQDELICLDAYITLRQMRSQNGFDYVTSVPAAHLSHLVPRLFLQPIVENSIVHGFVGVPRRGRIVIITYERNNKLFLAVSDNGKGIPEDSILKIIDGRIETSAHSHGIGVHNVIQRLKLNFSDSSENRIENNAGEGVCVTLDLGTIQKKYPNESNSQ